uniref:WD-repeat protein n=1 Tax=Solanum tuberosum TaxID=4113 RepID=M1B0C5_SOLTU
MSRWSKDNDVILWDVVGETDLFRLRGHRDQVTDVVFLGSSKKLVMTSKDKFLRRQRKDRVATMRFNKSGDLLACQVAGKTVEIFRVLDESESKRKAKIRISRKEKKAAKEDREATEKGETERRRKLPKKASCPTFYPFFLY